MSQRPASNWEEVPVENLIFAQTCAKQLLPHPPAMHWRAVPGRAVLFAPPWVRTGEARWEMLCWGCRCGLWVSCLVPEAGWCCGCLRRGQPTSDPGDVRGSSLSWPSSVRARAPCPPERRLSAGTLQRVLGRPPCHTGYHESCRVKYPASLPPGWPHRRDCFHSKRTIPLLPSKKHLLHDKFQMSLQGGGEKWRRNRSLLFTAARYDPPRHGLIIPVLAGRGGTFRAGTRVAFQLEQM